MITTFTSGHAWGKTFAMYNMYRNIRNGKEVIDVEPTEINGKRLITSGDKFD